MKIIGLSPDKACMERSQHCASVLRISSSSADSDRNIISKIFKPSHVLFVPDLVLVPFEQGQDQLVEKDPSVLEKVIEEVAHVLTWNDRSKQAKDPLASINAGPQIEGGHASVELRKICLHEQLDNCTVHKQSSELQTIDLLQVVVSY